MNEQQGKSNVIDFNAARQWTLLSWMEAVSANCRQQNREMDLEDWLAALDGEPLNRRHEPVESALGDNVILLANYRHRKQDSLLKKMMSE